MPRSGIGLLRAQHRFHFECRAAVAAVALKHRMTDFVKI
jgi:hypothetical protein